MKGQCGSCWRSHLWTGAVLCKRLHDSVSGDITTGLTPASVVPAEFPDWTPHSCTRVVLQDCWEGPHLTPAALTLPRLSWGLFPPVALSGQRDQGRAHQAQSRMGLGAAQQGQEGLAEHLSSCHLGICLKLQGVTLARKETGFGWRLSLVTK